MSDYVENTIRTPEVDTELCDETSMATTSTPTRAPGAILGALLAQTTSTPSSSSSTDIPPAPPLPRLPNQYNQPVRVVSEILPRLFLSDIFTAVNADTLRSFRITHIISVIEHAVAFPAVCLSHGDSKTRVFPELNSHSVPASEPILPPFMTLHVPLSDLPAVDIFSYFAPTRDFIITALKNEDARVLVHCYKGQSRSPTIVAAYLISTLKISTSNALKTIQAKRPMVLPNRGFMRQLEQWEEVVREEDNIICSDK